MLQGFQTWLNSIPGESVIYALKKIAIKRVIFYSLHVVSWRQEYVVATLTPTGHSFCRSCWIAWSEKIECPYCRQKITEPLIYASMLWKESTLDASYSRRFNERDVNAYFSWLRSRRSYIIAEKDLTLAETLLRKNGKSLRTMKGKEQAEVLAFFIRGGVEKHSAWRIVLNIRRFWCRRNRRNNKLK